MKKLQNGFTLIELLIVIAILMLLLMIVFMNLKGQSDRARDLKRKTDLYNLRKAFEDYNNDKSAFPPQSVVDTCGGTDMVPYFAQIPCDPVTRMPYGYFPASNGGYRICAKLSDLTDPSIVSMGCGGQWGCGLGGGYNYCLATGVTPSAVGTVDQVASQMAGQFACAPVDFFGTSYCKSYADPVGSGCPRTYADSHCNNECQSNPAVRCKQ